MRLAVVWMVLTSALWGKSHLLFFSKKDAVSKVQIFGQRSSGTNYLQALIEKNFPDFAIDFRYGWKHYPCWQNPSWKREYGPHFSPYYLDLVDNSSYLFIFIVRDPYDWLRSFYQHAHNVSFRVDRPSFYAFITSPWYVEHEDDLQRIFQTHLCKQSQVTSKNDWIVQHFKKPLLHDSLSSAFWDINPDTFSYFPNVLALRAARLRTFFTIAQKVDNMCFIRYEDLRDFPEEICKVSIKKSAAFFSNQLV